MRRRKLPEPPRSVLQRTEAFFGGRSPLIVAVLGTLFILVVGLVDYFSGPELSVALLFLMPIALVTWNLGRQAGIVASLLAALVGLGTDLLSSTGRLSIPEWNATVVWNAWVRALVFLAFTYLLSTLKDFIEDREEKLDETTEVASGLQQLNDVKDTLLHAVSHDLKGPLAGILGAMQTLRREHELALSHAEQEELYEVIEQSGRKMNRLLDDLLDLDRIDRGKLQPRREPTDVGALARRVAAEAHGLEAHPIRIEADPVLVDVDAAKVDRIVENLLVNAARHTPAGTPVHVRVRKRRDGVTLVVEDEGPGVPVELRESLFEPFRQGPGSTGKGAGIGLSLVQRFAQLHGGDATIEGRRGGGARFVVILPGEVRAPEEPARDVDSGEDVAQLRAV